MPTPMRTTKMSPEKYQELVRRVEKRFGADKSWEELPVVHAPRVAKGIKSANGTRSAKGTRKRPRPSRPVEMDEAVWKALTSAAKRHHVTAPGVMEALTGNKEALDHVIESMIARGVLKTIPR